jgi:L-histidine N-alpha-methyltransferase
VAFLGSTIGNFLPGRRARFFRDVAELLGPGDGFLLGVDLVKDVRVLDAAYNDAAGVTAEFNLNVLRVLNRELGASFPLDAFEHVAFFDREKERIEMWLRSTRAFTVEIEALNLAVRIERHEEILTEISCKFTREGVTRELQGAGLRPRRWETDTGSRFALTLAELA